MTHSKIFETIESRRISRLKALDVLDTAAEPIFDSLARAASAVCGTPVKCSNTDTNADPWIPI